MSDNIQLSVGKSGSNNVVIDAQELVTGRTCVIGQSGSGKSYLIAVLCEKLLENNIAFCIVDTEGEYFSLKQKFEVLWVGGRDADVDLENVDLDDLIRKSIENNTPIILDVSDVLDERKVVADFSKRLYEIGTELRQPYLLIVEEADKFVGQNKDSLKEIEEISKRGRKRGIGLLVATQRPSLVNKNVLSQCGNRFIGKLATENDLKAVDLFFSDRKELEALPALSQGEFFVSGGLIKEKIKMRSVERVTQHKGLTPKLVKKETGKILELKASLGIDVHTGADNSTRKEIYKTKTQSQESVGIQITKEQLEKITEEKKKKKHGIFGEKEKLVSVEMVYQPLIWVQVSSKEGLIRKEFRNFSFILDGVTGDFIELENGLRRSDGISQFLGLDENQIKVLLELDKSKRATTAELELKTKLSEMTVRKIVSGLQDKKMVTFSMDGRSKIYSPLVDSKIPDIKQEVQKPATGPFSGKNNKPVITEASVRNIIKAIKAEADITKFEVFYYPIWQVNLDGRNRSSDRFQASPYRKIKIDGVTGKEI